MKGPLETLTAKPQVSHEQILHQVNNTNKEKGGH